MEGVAAAHAELGDQTVDNRIAAGTKEGYRNAISLMRKYSIDHGFGEFQPPVSIDFIRSFFGSLSIPRENNGLLSDSYVGTFQSALKFEHKLINSTIPSDILAWLSDFKRGHKRKIADLRYEGIMRKTEGNHF